MQWFYAVEDQQRGPVDEAELKRLHSAGMIHNDSLVWRDGLADWQPYRLALDAPTQSLTPDLAARPGVGVLCAECGRSFPPDQVVRLGEGFVCAACKPIRLQKMSEGVSDNSADTIRKDHIKHEASIKSVGIFYFLGAGLMALAGLAPALSGRGEDILFALVFFAFAVGLVAAGVGIRRLKPWARIVSGVLSGIGLLGFPLGTLINGYILYLLFSRKGSTVFSEEYQGIIAATPHIKYKTSIVVWILVGLLLLLGLLAIIGLISARARP
jgi:hypothetical protein